MASENRGPQVSGVAILFLVLSTISVFLRSYCRAFVIKTFGWDDGFAIAAWVAFVCYSTFSILGVKYGTGQHAAELSLEELSSGLKWWWACEPAYVLASMAMKLSIALFLLRLSTTKTHRFIIWSTLVVMEVTSFVYFLVFVFQCQPASYFWNRYTGAEGKCVNENIPVIVGYVYSAVSCACDWILGILPIFVVWNLQMNPRTKLSVGLILAVGAIASTATIVRIPYLRTLRDIDDFLYATTDIAIWSTIETGVGITASSLATIRPLFRNFYARSKLFGSSTKPLSNAWPADPSAAYIKQKNTRFGESSCGFYSGDAIQLRGGVITTIATGSIEDDNLDSQNGYEGKHIPIVTKRGMHTIPSSPTKKQKDHWAAGGRNDAKETAGRETSEDSVWGMNGGITKTTVNTISSVRLDKP